MKEDEELINKKLLFMLYANTPYLYKNNFGTFAGRLLESTHHFDSHIEKAWLRLRSLYDMTDEDCRFINELEEWNYENIDSMRNTILNCLLFNRGATKVHQYDYLRSKGYALPFMKWSVEEMIEKGWIKILKA